MTPTDGAGAVPAGGGSSLPLPGGPGIDPAGITTGARGASLKRDAKAKVTPAHCIARSAAWIELRRFGAAVRAVVGRRKASAPRSARAASDDAAHSFAPFGALPPLIFWRQKDWWLWSAQLGRGRRRGNESACFTLPCRGRVAHRRCAGWGARRCRDSQRAARAFTPTRRASRVDLSPPREGEDKRCANYFIYRYRGPGWLNMR